ncbi:MAG TPA: hypothetical protein DCP49_00175, partial [Erysipelotrichaceae bacterium]|nr:hypothetical protein [Erysipelotrichaceae bacterium]
SKNNAYNLKEKGRLLARSISQTDVLYYTRSYFPLTLHLTHYMNACFRFWIKKTIPIGPLRSMF